VPLELHLLQVLAALSIPSDATDLRAWRCRKPSAVASPTTVRAAKANCRTLDVWPTRLTAIVSQQVVAALRLDV